jgi:hypothetical protein
MDVFIERLPWDGLATRTLTLENDRLAIRFKNIARSLDDDYRYGKIDPDIKTVRRGETGWSNVVYGLVVTSVVFFVLSKMSPSSTFRNVVIGFQLCAAAAAVCLLSRIFLKRDHLYIMDTAGDCIVSFKSTPRSRAFAAKLREKIAAAKAV